MTKTKRVNNVFTFLQKIDPSGGLDACWPWLGFKNLKGYGQASLNNKTMLAHRWSYQHHYGIEIPNRLQVRHLCDNPACCNPLHLLLGTNQENVDDKMKRGRFKPKQTRFSQEQFETMKQLRASGVSRDRIGLMFRCHKTTVAHHERYGFHTSNRK